jgi:hypothetical protein
MTNQQKQQQLKYLQRRLALELGFDDDDDGGGISDVLDHLLTIESRPVRDFFFLRQRLFCTRSNCSY